MTHRRPSDASLAPKRSAFQAWASFVLSPLILIALLERASAQTPQWIWGDAARDQEARFFKRAVSLPEAPETAVLSVSCDNVADVFINGQNAARNTEWSKAKVVSVLSRLKTGGNEIVVAARNEGGSAGLLLKLDLKYRGGRKETIVTDTSWQTVENKTGGNGVRNLPQDGWVAAKALGPLGMEPWGDVLKPATATPAESLQVLSGFKAQLLRSASPEEGSWVSMTVDNKGRLIVSPQGGEPMMRMTLDAQGSVSQVETIDLPVRGAMGLLYAFDSLYVNGQGKEGYHLYRLRDTNGDDQYDSVELIRRWGGGAGEHGAHGIVQGPNGKLYTVQGNFVDVPSDVASDSPHKNYLDDVVLPRLEDGNGFGAGRKPPGGFVARMNPDGTHCELFASGQRNTYDIAFNPQGELFGFDSDMEWDWGMPWYRPTRVFHVVSGGDQGFREGSAKWPEYYSDSLPAAVNVGIGSPTGVRFGTGAKFPSRYQRALYVMDWSYGRILAVHLREAGASYMASFENFVKGKPLNVTDLEIGPDGAMYFLIGGRGTQAGLYRVSYVGNETTTPAPMVSDASAVDARALRHRLESLHGHPQPGGADMAWPSLGASDRWIRYAARIAIEAQPVAQWRERALAETNAAAGLQALLALSRLGSRDDQEPVLKTLARWPLDSLDDEQKLVKLRVIEVSLARHGLPSAELRQLAIDKLSKQLPAASPAMNRELSQILVALQAPGIVGKLLALRDAATTQEEKMIYAVALRKAEGAWTLEQRQQALAWIQQSEPTPRHPAEFDQWFQDVGIPSANGASFNGFLKGLRKDFAKSMSEGERGQLADLIQDAPAKASRAVATKPRAFVKHWAMDDLTPALSQVSKGRDYLKGKEAFAAAQCATCHRFGSDGGAVGPDITAVASRFSRLDILSSILEPSKVISEQYENTTFTTRDDEDITGRILEERPDRFVLLVDPIKGTQATVKKADVKARQKAKLSPMPEGLVDLLQKDEFLDLIAYVESMGNPGHPSFKR
ncbi:MAG: c-type cytochrome [Verrucomicrobia bacterium]|nr:c-type cytochrome [Verrucomicrobiota bacterium]MBI3871110.1 c-type cytochrome [Verrucomicrobiota bacterium]